jgi:hypothetical protein
LKLKPEQKNAIPQVPSPVGFWMYFGSHKSHNLQYLQLDLRFAENPFGGVK